MILYYNRILFCFRFPSCPKKRQIWLNRCKLANEEVLPNRKICSFHFEPTCFKTGLKRRLLYPDAVPTIFGKAHVKTTNLPLKNVKGIIYFLPIITVQIWGRGEGAIICLVYGKILMLIYNIILYSINSTYYSTISISSSFSDREFSK